MFIRLAGGLRWLRDFYIAWLTTPQDAFDPVAMHRSDLPWTNITLSETEGSDATTVTVTTPKIPTASLVGKFWAMLSFEHPNGTLYPVARMKRRILPVGAQDGVQDLQFDAGLFDNWRDLRDADLGPLKAGAAWDPILVRPTRQGDPTEILDGHRLIGHFDRVTCAYSTPELLGEHLPTRTFNKSDWIGWESGGGIKVGPRTAQPLRGVQVTVYASWMQLIQGMIDCSSAIQQLFPTLNVGPAGYDPFFGSYDPSVVIAAGNISTLTPDEFERSWPKEGAQIGGNSGYVVVKSSLVRVDNTSFVGIQAANTPATVGPLTGAASLYCYVMPNGQPPVATDVWPISLDVAYYQAQLVVAYVGRQKREETASFYIANGGNTDPNAPIQNLDLRCEDPSIDPATAPWLPATHYASGALVRVNWWTWEAKRDHLSSTNFAADVQASDWQIAQTNASYIGGPGGITYWHTARALATLYAAGMKATKIIALRQRSIPVEFSVPFEDIVASGFSTAWSATVNADDPEIPGGTAFGKVVALTVTASSDPTGFPKATIRLASCDGAGTPGATGGTSFGYTAADYDRVALADFSGYPPPVGPAPGGGAVVTNNVQQQIAYIAANSYQAGVAGRSDPKANDPKQLLRKVPTSIAFAFNPVNGPTLQGYVPIQASAWPGPRQINPPSV